MTLQNAFNPNYNKLIVDGDSHTAVIFDAEIDPVNITFNCEDVVEIDCSDYQHLTFTRENLEKLLELLNKSESIFNSEE